MDFVKNFKIKMIRLLPYSPELNPIEQYWKNLKRWLGTKPIFSKSDLMLELKKALKKDFLMPKISDY
jgi:transposase